WRGSFPGGPDGSATGLTMRRLRCGDDCPEAGYRRVFRRAQRIESGGVLRIVARAGARATCVLRRAAKRVWGNERRGLICSKLLSHQVLGAVQRWFFVGAV